MASRQRTPKAGLAVSPPDNLPLRTELIEQYVPQLSLADLKAVGEAMQRRWEALQASHRRATLDAHYAHLRVLPAGTPLQVVRAAVGQRGGSLAKDEIVTMERSLRSPSTNIMVHDQHGQRWRLPMDELISETEDESIRTALRSELEARSREALLRGIERSAAARRGE